MSFAVVIGAQYGDEGKGVLTDYLATPDSLVVRFNGGAQAGHTVIAPNGQRHVFQHVGAGTFRGARTLLSRDFIVNPILFAREWETLYPCRPLVSVDRSALVTTPYDMLINQAVERARGSARHGSCGVGINETVTRSETIDYRLRAKDLYGPATALAQRLRVIANEWVPRRCLDLHVSIHGDAIAPALRQFRDSVDLFVQNVRETHDLQEINLASDVVFEGAQGLRLDECSGDFPHVTRSRTGLTNVDRLLAGRTDRVDVYYVTRSYVTRHGAGPLRRELPVHPGRLFGYETNVTNEFQGSLRYALIDEPGLRDAIRLDLSRTSLNASPRLVVTCQDQYNCQPESLNVGVPLWGTSHGPTRDHVRPCESPTR